MSEQKENLIKAVISVMSDVKNIEKNMNVGDGQNSYKGVSDKDVKHKIGEAMAKHGLCIFQNTIEETVNVERWTDSYGKPKQSVFTQVKCTYTIYHTSGESMVIQGYGHGIDTQDKSAGKATTYALKNALLYTFLVPTGSLDDTDTTHSDQMPIPPAQSNNQPSTSQSGNQDKPWLNLMNQAGDISEKVLSRVRNHFESGFTIDDLKSKVKISKKEMDYIQNNILNN